MRGKRTVLVAAMVAVLVLAAACGGGGGSKPTLTLPPTVARTTSPSETGNTVSPSPPPSSSAVPSSTGPSWVPPAYGAAQPAVDAYLKMYGAYTKTFTDPVHNTSKTFDAYLIGTAKYEYEQSLIQEREQGKYYQGTPDLQRIRVESQSLTSVIKTVTLNSCPLRSLTDPFVEYFQATRKPVPQPVHKIQPPYRDTFKMIRLGGRWQLESISVDSSRTCVA